MVLEKICPEYRLRCCKIDEKGARQVINERRPVVARFSWKGQQEDRFKKFYKMSPKAILRASGIVVGGMAMSLL